MMSTLRRDGEWPGRVRLHWLFMSAQLRPWDDDADAVVLGLSYGTEGFASRCVRAALELAPTVRSNVAPSDRWGTWAARGFEPELDLKVMSCLLPENPAPVPGIVPYSGRVGDLMEVDNLAFEKPWRIGGLGLEDSVATTPRSAVQVIEEDDRVVSYAIIGSDRHGVAYLQRIATIPERQGQGLGSRLISGAKGWAVEQGCEQLLLNVNPRASGVIDFYRRHGFADHAMKLKIFRRDRE